LINLRERDKLKDLGIEGGIWGGGELELSGSG